MAGLIKMFVLPINLKIYFITYLNFIIEYFI